MSKNENPLKLYFLIFAGFDMYGHYENNCIQKW